MQSPEAKEYFRTLGTLHSQIKSMSPEQADQFLEEEKRSKEYDAALTILKFHKPKHFTREVSRDLTQAKTYMDSNATALGGRLLDLPPAKTKRFLSLNQTNNDLKTIILAFEPAGKITDQESDGDTRLASRYRSATNLLRLSAMYRGYTVGSEQLKILESLNQEDETIAPFRMRVNLNHGPLNVSISEYNLLGFEGEDFKNKRKTDYKKINGYLEFFLLTFPMKEFLMYFSLI